jgi:hypothetical protein
MPIFVGISRIATVWICGRWIAPYGNTPKKIKRYSNWLGVDHKPVLRELATSLNIGLLNSNGNPYNTRQLGTQIIKCVQDIGAVEARPEVPAEAPLFAASWRRPNWDVRAWRNYMKFSVTIDRDEDGAWVVECPAIPGCISQGETKDEALENIRDAIYQCL